MRVYVDQYKKRSSDNAARYQRITREENKCVAHGQRGRTKSKTCLFRDRTSNPVSLGLRRQKYDDALRNKHYVASQVGIPGCIQAYTSGKGNVSRFIARQRNPNYGIGACLRGVRQRSGSLFVFVVGLSRSICPSETIACGS